jgi:UDP-N-acetyl-D-galactosamine dehydrogenase
VIAIDRAKLGIVGLGYVGLPLAVEFGRQLPTLGFDIDARRISDLKAGRDDTREVAPMQLAQATRLRFTERVEALRDCNVYIVTVPTPLDRFKRPDLSHLEAACRTLGPLLGGGEVIIFESTVYPGATEEVCVPILESESGQVFNRDFFVGYSPERINPGDPQHRLSTIRKVTAGSTCEAADFVDALYARIITAGTHRASSIRVAEAAKVIENTQRDVNIALVNELALIFNRLGIDTREVLEAAASKWNFLPFQPGLVGGHCIGVDPYYLTHKAQEIGYHPEVILAGRRINDSMGGYVAEQLLKLMQGAGVPLGEARVLVMGFTFKEDCPDVRNTRVIDLVRELQGYNLSVDIHDPCADRAAAAREYAVRLTDQPQPGCYDAIVLAVAHRQFRGLGAQAIRALGKKRSVLYDVKGILPAPDVDGRL